MRDAVIISDLHLGSEICQARALTRFLESLDTPDSRPCRLILNGDVFDSMNFHRLKRWHWKVLSKIRKLSDHIEVIWIVGNHDGPAQDISHLLGVDVRDEFDFTSGDRRILFQHGHQYDRFIDEHPWLTRIADIAYAFFQWIDPSHRIARFSKRSSKTFLRCARIIEESARGTAARRGFDAVCCGHTHHAVAIEEGEVQYYNSGSWCELPCHYLVVDQGVITIETYAPTYSAEDSDAELQELTLA